MTTKRILFLNRRAPHGTIHAHEALEVVLIGAAFEQEVALAFLDDGVFQLSKAQETKAIGAKNFSQSFGALGDYEVTRLYVERESLDRRGLSPDDLQDITYEDEDDDWAKKPSIQIVSRAELAAIMADQDVVLSF